MFKTKKIAILLLALGLSIAFGAETKAATNRTPDATLDIDSDSLGIGFGFSWGGGTLHYKGKDYRIKVRGMSLGKVGFAKATARGNVYNLKRLQDFDGNYTSAGVGMTLAGGRSAVAMKNQNDVKVAVYTTTQGLNVAIGGGGVDMAIKK